jgi:long-chain fatty acid transport protein
MKNTIWRCSATLVGLIGVSMSSQTRAAGFQLFEQGISGLGTAYASSAAAQDATTVYWNPAGMTFLQEGNNFISGGVHLLKTKAEFTNKGSTTSSGAALRGGNGGDAGDTTPLPNLFYAHRFDSGLALGLGLSPQFGLATEYDANWVGRYQAIKSELATVSLNPTLAYRFNDWFAIGGGVNILKADAELTNKINFGAALPALGALPAGALSQQADAKLNISGDDLAYGYNLAAMFKLGEATKLGINYRSKIKVKVEGNANFTAPNVTSAVLPVGPGGALVTVPISPAAQAQIVGAFNARFPDQDITAEVDLPEVVSLGVHTQIDPQWAIMGDLSWTNWSRFKELVIKLQGGSELVTPENWDDTFKASIGASYKPTDKLTLSAGLAYDQQAASDKFLTPRIPDASRTWLAFGVNFAFSNAASLDVGYAHIMVDSPKLNKTSDESVPAVRTTLRGDYDASVDILSVQFNFRF